jgi:hypothetical protein
MEENSLTFPWEVIWNNLNVCMLQNFCYLYIIVDFTQFKFSLSYLIIFITYKDYMIAIIKISILIKDLMIRYASLDI